MLVAAVYVLRLDRTAGLFVDDAWYVLLGKALATGQGFGLVSSPDAPILPSVPPGYPALLSVVFMLVPRFPDNVLLLKSVSIVAMLGVALLTFRYFQRDRGIPSALAAVAAAAVALIPGFVMLATSTLMAECVFTLLQLAAVMAVDRAAQHDESAAAVRAGALIGAAWLVRSSGTALAIGAFGFLIARRRWRTAAIASGIAALLAVPWAIYSAAHEPSAAARDAHGGSIVVPYRDVIRLRIAGYTASGFATPSEIAARIPANIANIFGRDAGALVAPVAFRSSEESGEETIALGGLLGLRAGSMGNAPATMVFSFIVAAIAVFGYARAVRQRPTAAEFVVPVTVAMLLVVPFFTYRFDLPLAPFFFLYLMRGVEGLAPASIDRWKPVRIVVLCVAGFSVLDHARYVAASRRADAASTVDWLGEWKATEEVLSWMQAHLDDRTPVATTNPALVYLVTGRKGIALDRFEERWDELKARGIRYLVCLWPAELPHTSKPYRVLFQPSGRRMWIVEM